MAPLGLLAAMADRRRPVRSCSASSVRIRTPRPQTLEGFPMRLLKQAALPCCGLLALAAASIVSAGDDSSPAATFRAGTAEWIAAYNAGNVDRILALYAEDSMVMPPEAPVASGHAAIREFLTKDIASSKAAGITLTDISSGSTTGTSGDLGWHTGTFAVLNANGKTVGT